MTAVKTITIGIAPGIMGSACAIDSYDYDSSVAREFARNCFGGKTSLLNVTYRH